MTGLKDLTTELLCRRLLALAALAEIGIEAFFFAGVGVACVEGVVGSKHSETGVSGLKPKRPAKERAD